MNSTEAYEILGLQFGLNKKEVEKAYRALALRWHPDKNIDNPTEAAEKFKRIFEAYDLLVRHFLVSQPAAEFDVAQESQNSSNTSIFVYPPFQVYKNIDQSPVLYGNCYLAGDLISIVLDDPEQNTKWIVMSQNVLLFEFRIDWMSDSFVEVFNNPGKNYTNVKYFYEEFLKGLEYKTKESLERKQDEKVFRKKITAMRKALDDNLPDAWKNPSFADLKSNAIFILMRSLSLIESRLADGQTEDLDFEKTMLELRSNLVNIKKISDERHTSTLFGLSIPVIRIKKPYESDVSNAITEVLKILNQVGPEVKLPAIRP